MIALLQICYGLLGEWKSGDAAVLPDVDDGSSDHHGPTAARCRPHGGEDHTRDAHVQEDQTHYGGVRLSQGYHHAQSRYGLCVSLGEGCYYMLMCVCSPARW